MAHLSALAVAATLRAERIGIAQVKYSNDLSIRIGELEMKALDEKQHYGSGRGCAFWGFRS